MNLKAINAKDVEDRSMIPKITPTSVTFNTQRNFKIINGCFLLIKFRTPSAPLEETLSVSPDYKSIYPRNKIENGFEKRVVFEMGGEIESMSLDDGPSEIYDR